MINKKRKTFFGSTSIILYCNMSSIRLCNNSNGSLKLNESLSNGGKYIMEGIFAELGVMNVNHRIYTENEYLKHLQYLREDVKRGDLLGELDHPEDRFEVRVKEASHRIIDIWYEPNTKTVMGKIEILDTPNGLIAKALVDAGIPLHISSRAAGTINKDNTVSIQQIYTYDIVAKPGFARATLSRVNESAESNSYSDEVMNFLKESEKRENNVEHLNETLSSKTIAKDPAFRKEAVKAMESKDNDINIMALSNHINEDDNKSQVDTSSQSAAAAGVPTAPMTLEASADDNNADDKENKDQNGQDNKSTSDSNDNKSEDKKDKKSDSVYTIKDVELVDPESDDKKDDKSDEDEEGNKKDEDSDKKDEDDKSDEDKEGSEGNKTDECDQTADNSDTDKTQSNECGGNCAKNEKEATEKNKLFDKKEEVGQRKSDFTDKLDELISELKKKKKVDEGVRNAVVTEHPFTAFLNESDIVEFSQLNESQKSKVTNYLKENQIIEPALIARMWKNGLNESVETEPIWLRRADAEYRKLYEEASDIEKYNLQESAKYFLFESQRDIDVFWLNSGLKSKKERQIIAEAYKQSAPITPQRTVMNALPYSMDEVQNMIEFYKNR